MAREEMPAPADVVSPHSVTARSTIASRRAALPATLIHSRSVMSDHPSRANSDCAPAVKIERVPARFGFHHC